MKKLENIENITELHDLLININRRNLNEKEHIKKYNKLRNLHSKILDDMEEYMLVGKYNINEYSLIIIEELKKYKYVFNQQLDFKNVVEEAVLLEMFCYKNHEKVPALTDIYLEKKKFRNKEKIKMLECMKNSYVGLFKIISADSRNGYVTYKDVFTDKIFKIVDISMSSTFDNNDKHEIYTYNRIITYDDISFATNIYCNFLSDSKKIMDFIKSSSYKKYSSFVRCLVMYDICKKYSKLQCNYNNQYGNVQE